MKYHQYKGVVEREYKMSLKKVMHQICIIEGLNAMEGAKKLGIARSVFAYWQRYFRYEKTQVLFDQTIDDLMEVQTRYSDELKTKKTPAKADNSSDSIEELEEVVDSLIEYYKYIHYTSEGMALKTAKLPLYKFSKSMITDYKNGTLIKELQAET